MGNTNFNVSTPVLAVFLVLLLFSIGYKERTVGSAPLEFLEVSEVNGVIEEAEDNVPNMATIDKTTKKVDKYKETFRYIERYKAIAQREMKKHKIPASITLAQGILESDRGLSILSRKDNNHFGIKCKAKCLNCLCRNYKDDDPWDMFRVFETAEESFVEHSNLLNGDRYKHLKKYGNNWKKWAYGLKRAGYATNPTYAEKLINIIHTYKLYKYDRIESGKKTETRWAQF